MNDLTLPLWKRGSFWAAVTATVALVGSLIMGSQTTEQIGVVIGLWMIAFGFQKRAPQVPASSIPPDLHEEIVRRMRASPPEE